MISIPSRPRSPPWSRRIARPRPRTTRHTSGDDQRMARGGIRSHPGGPVLLRLAERRSDVRSISVCMTDGVHHSAWPGWAAATPQPGVQTQSCRAYGPGRGRWPRCSWCVPIADRLGRTRGHKTTERHSSGIRVMANSIEGFSCRGRIAVRYLRWPSAAVPRPPGHEIRVLRREED